MGQRNMLCTNPMLDLEMDPQGRGHHPPEPCILLGSIADLPYPNVHPVLSASGSASNHDLHHVPGHHDSSLFFGGHYNCLQHHCSITNVDLGVAAPSNFYNPYMIHSSASRICPVSLNHISSNQLPSSSNHGVMGVGVDDYERNNHFMDCVRSSGKRKIAEGVQGHFLHLNSSASSSSSSSGAQLNNGPHQREEQTESEAALLDGAAFIPPEYQSSGTLTLAEVSERSVRSRSNTISLQLDSALAHYQNHLVQGNYMGQPFHPASTSWVEQQFGSNGRNGVTSAWNNVPAMPYLHGRNANGGFSEIMSMGGQGYQDTSTSRNSAIVFHSHSMHQQLHHHHPPLPVQAMRGHSYQAQVPLPSYRHPMNNVLHHGPPHTSRDGLEAEPRHPRPFPSNGLRIYRPQRNGVYQTAPDGRNNPHLRFLSADEVAILEIPGYYEVGNFIDQHRDMRLDIDDMSYEELLALGERIGSVKTGLSEETILRHLKTRIHVPSVALLEEGSMDRETETCIICQVEYENQEKIGTLDCAHEYHVDCIRQWLLVKNVCPICKMPALAG
ncbi:zinc finger protein [Macleaya cordata]|uniref:RING-type E3 ubiquitin transferase n=1 Tax=Macleaya cordata TaxID=56857 RepID=A0A200QKZ0_MACCD|nr:zinc finger protein [Macleaya cordata]